MTELTREPPRKFNQNVNCPTPGVFFTPGGWDRKKKVDGLTTTIPGGVPPVRPLDALNAGVRVHAPVATRSRGGTHGTKIERAVCGRFRPFTAVRVSHPPNPAHRTRIFKIRCSK